MSATVDEIIHDPIGWAQVRLSGGWKRLAGTTAVYALAVIVLHVLTYRLLRNDVGVVRFADGALQLMLMVSAIFIFFVGTAAIKKAVQRDFTTEMIQSHRLTAMSGATACMGYLTGPLAQVLMVTVVNWLTCTILAPIGSTALGTSFLGTAALFGVMLVMGLTWWTVALLAALCSRGKVPVAPLLIVVLIVTNTKLIYVAPGAAMLLGSTVATEVIDKTTLAQQAWWLMFSIMSQLALALAFFVAAARKFHRDDLPAFDPLLALTVAALAGLISGVGLRFWEPDPTSLLIGRLQTDPGNRLFATTMLLTLVLYLPVASSAWKHATWARRKQLDRQSRGAPPFGHVSTAIIACQLGFGVLVTIAGGLWPILMQTGDPTEAARRAGAALAAALLSLLTLGGLLRVAYANGQKAIWLVVLYLVVTWALPPFVDASIDALREIDVEGPRSLLFAGSPVGTWLWAFKAVESPVGWGLAVQTALAAGATLLARRAKY